MTVASASEQASRAKDINVASLHIVDIAVASSAPQRLATRRLALESRPLFAVPDPPWFGARLAQRVTSRAGPADIFRETTFGGTTSAGSASPFSDGCNRRSRCAAGNRSPFTVGESMNVLKRHKYWLGGVLAACLALSVKADAAAKTPEGTDDRPGHRLGRADGVAGVLHEPGLRAGRVRIVPVARTPSTSSPRTSSSSPFPAWPSTSSAGA